MDGSRYPDDPIDAGWRDHPPSLLNLVQMVRRQIGLVAVCIVACLMLGFAYIVISDPLYTAKVSLYVNPEAGAENRADAASVYLDTQVELIQSDETTAAVIRDLNLDERPEFAGEPSRIRAMLADLRMWLGLPLADSEMEAADGMYGVITSVRQGLDVRRVGNTRIIEVRFTSVSRDLAVAIANAFARVHVSSVAGREERSTERRLERLESRAEEMRQKIGAVDELVQGILIRSGKYAADPQDLQRHTAGLRQQLSDLDAESAALSMKLSLIGSAEDVSVLSPFAAETPEGMRLLNDLSAAEARLEELRRRSDIPRETLSQIEGGLANLRATLRQEVARVANSVELQLDMITAKHTSIAAQISALQDYFTSSDWAQLEAGRRDKEFYETMYQNSLTQMEGIFREPTRSDLRIVSDALPPLNPSFPDYQVVLAIAGTFGAFIGAGLAMFREWNRFGKSIG